jgi:GNAT superfamily N-acetyltransferase
VPDTPARLVELGPDDDLFADWCAVWSAAQLLDRPEDPPRPMSDHVALARRLLSDGGSTEGTHRAALLGDAVVGALRLILPTKDNPTVAIVDVAVHPDHRRRGLGSRLLAQGVRLAQDRGRTQLLAEVDEPAPGTAGRAFALRHGFTCDLLETRRDLVLPVDERRLSALEADARGASRGYDLVTWTDRTPDELVDDRALLERRMSTDAPHGDLPVEEEQWDAARVREYEQTNLARGRTVLSAGAVKDGRMVAFTDLHVPLAQPQRAHQGGTLVLREHRGHRLGALVKTAVLRELAATQPAVRRISTYNADSNTPMVAVNTALGFEPAGQLSSWSRRA